MGLAVGTAYLHMVPIELGVRVGSWDLSCYIRFFYPCTWAKTHVNMKPRSSLSLFAYTTGIFLQFTFSSESEAQSWVIWTTKEASMLALELIFLQKTAVYYDYIS
jgi:hypothetical protein